MKQIQIMKGAEPFLIKRGEIGILLLHGFTSSPYDMRLLGNYLAKQNYTVYCPLLAGHGTQAEDLERTSFKQLKKSVKDGYTILKKHAKKIYVAGSSTGSNLGILVLHKKSDVRGFIMMGMPLIFAGMFQILFTIFAPVMTYTIPIITKFKRFWVKDYPASAKKLMKKKVHYTKFPLKKIIDIKKIIMKTRKVLPTLKKPVLIMDSSSDHVLNEDNPKAIYKLIGGKEKQMVLIPKSYHVFLRDKNRMKAFKAIDQFIKLHSV